jgi:hypothetical protein
MIDTWKNLLFRCSHRRLTRPVAVVCRPGTRKGGIYVVCLDCGKQFSYDPIEMRVGKPLVTLAEASSRGVN